GMDRNLGAGPPGVVRGLPLPELPADSTLRTTAGLWFAPVCLPGVRRGYPEHGQRAAGRADRRSAAAIDTRVLDVGSRRRRGDGYSSLRVRTGREGRQGVQPM